jgi:hypothetical protein
MILTALCSSLIGATLGTRLRVFVLLPVTFVGVGLIALIASLNGSTLSSALGAIAVSSICLQLGYLGGLLTRYCMVAARLAPGPSLSSTVTRS